MNTPKFSIGQKVWFMKDNKPASATVVRIVSQERVAASTVSHLIKCTDKPPVIESTSYDMADINNGYVREHNEYYEAALAESKEALLASL